MCQCQYVSGVREMTGGLYLMCIVSPGVSAEIIDLQESYKKRLSDLKNVTNQERREIVKEFSLEFFELACQRIEATGMDLVADQSWCCKCNDWCNVCPPTGPGTMWLEIAGNTCTPWSQAGLQLGWLDRQSVAALCWGFFLLKHKPDFIVNECTRRFDAQGFFARVLGAGHKVTSVVVSPSDMGIPSRRHRRYTIATKCSRIFPAFDFGDIFPHVASRSIMMRPDVFFCAPEDAQQTCLAELLRRRGLVAPRQSWQATWKLALSFSDRQRLREYIKKYKEGLPGCLCDVSQNYKWIRSLSQLCFPTLVTNSIIYNLMSERLLVAPEYFAVNGVPVFAGYDDGDEVMLLPESTFSSFSFKTSRRLSGNMMSIPVVGSVIGTMLLCSNLRATGASQ